MQDEGISTPSETSKRVDGDEFFPWPSVRSSELTPVPAESGDDRRWLKNWQTNEVRWLRTRVDDLERQLRRRTIVLGSAFALSGFLALAAAGNFALTALHPPEPPATALAATAVGDAVAAESAGPVPEIGPPQAQQPLAALALGPSGDLRDLEVAEALYQAEIAELRGALASTRAEVDVLSEQLATSRQENETLNARLAAATGGIVRLNALLATATGGDAPADAGRQADPQGWEPDQALSWPR